MKKVYSYLKSLENLGYKLEIDRVFLFAKHWGLIPQNFPVIHVGGTNGKGSVSTIVSQILIELGYNVGTFTSPHLLTPRERLRYNLKEIPEKDFEEVVFYIKEIVEKSIEDGIVSQRLSYFETLTMSAIVYFKKMKVDYGVFEVGLGGRLDATNILNTALSVITTVSHDHTRILGGTIEKIAWEKAGIIKENGKVVVGKLKKRAYDVVCKIAKEKMAEVVETFNSKRKLKIFDDLSGIYSTEKWSYTLSPAMPGKHQLFNSSIAVKAVEELFNVGYDEKYLIERAIAKAKIQGRIEIKGSVIFDGAHNREGAMSLKGFIEKYLKNKNFIVLFGASKGKDLSPFFKYIFPLTKEIVITKAKSLRADEPEKIIKNLSKSMDLSKVVLIGELKKAICYVKEKFLKENFDYILITGSLYLVGDSKKIILNHKELKNILFKKKNN